jgi:hypothetical protein
VDPSAGGRRGALEIPDHPPPRIFTIVRKQYPGMSTLPSTAMEPCPSGSWGRSRAGQDAFRSNQNRTTIFRAEAVDGSDHRRIVSRSSRNALPPWAGASCWDSDRLHGITSLLGREGIVGTASTGSSIVEDIK